jgi:hypothetical protein
MESLNFLMAAAGAFLLAVAGNLLAAEIYDRCKGFSNKLLKSAVMRLPPDKQERYEEEWLAHLEECHSALSRLLHAGGCLYCASYFRNKNSSETEKKYVRPNNRADDNELPKVKSQRQNVVVETALDALTVAAHELDADVNISDGKMPGEYGRYGLFEKDHYRIIREE